MGSLSSSWKEKDTLNWIDSFEDGKSFYDIGVNVGILAYMQI